MKTTKKTLLLDMDGTTYNFHQRLAEKIVQEKRLPAEFRQRMSNLNERTSHKLGKLFTDDLQLQEEIQKIIYQLYQNEAFFASLELYPGMKELILQLDETYDVLFCTKPSVKPCGSENAKVQLMMRDFWGYWREKIVLAHDKTMVRWELLVDDTPKVLKGKYDPSRAFLLVDQPSNQWVNYPRVFHQQLHARPQMIAQTLSK